MRRALIGLSVGSLLAAGALVATNRDTPVTVAAAVKGGGVISIQCPAKPTLLKQVDPILNPGGGPSAHLHQFVGGTRVPDALDTGAFESEKVRAGGTTCPLDQDTAGYWFPPLIHSDTGVVLPAVHMNAYYRSAKGVDVEAFPPGFTMLAGHGTANVPPASHTQGGGISWSCRDSGPFRDEPFNCSNGRIMANVHFPNCLRSDGSMAYGTKDCVRSFPKLAIHARYAIGNGSRYELVPGTAGLHADFWNTWDQATLSGLVENCLDGGLDCKATTNANVLARCQCTPGEHPDPSPQPEPSPSPLPPPDPEAVIAEVVSCLGTERPLTCIKTALRAAGHIE
jgi:hypothetical protein